MPVSARSGPREEGSEVFGEVTSRSVVYVDVGRNVVPADAAL